MKWKRRTGIELRNVSININTEFSACLVILLASTGSSSSNNTVQYPAVTNKPPLALMM